MSDLMAIKAVIRAELKADGCSQADLARYLGCSPQYVHRVLSGKQDGRPAFIESMAHALGLSLAVAGDPR